MKRFVNAANLITSGSLAAGVLAMLLAADGQLGWAVSAVGVAAVLDSVDGYVARRTSACGPFGCQLDSLADLAAFGMAPALILHQGAFDAMPVPGAGLCVAYVVAGAWRLARFPLIEDREHFIGLPIPPAGLLAAVAGVLSVPAAAAAVLCLGLALLMVGSRTVPTIAELGRLAGDDGRREREDRDADRVRAPALTGE